MLKSLGAATTLSTVGVSVSGARDEPSFRETLKQSHRVLQAAGPKKQHEFLQNRGIATATDSATHKLCGPTQGGNDPSTQTLVESEISLWFSLYYDCGTGTYPNGTYIAELTWEYDPTWDDVGDNPMDYVGIGWDDNTWYYEDNNLDDMYVSHPNYINHYGGSSGYGPAWEVDDRYTLDDAWTDEHLYFFTGVHLDWNGSDSLKDNRTIAASYSHTWNSVTINSVSVGYPYGVSVGVGNEEKEWTKDTNDSGTFLRLRYNDIEGCK